MRIRAVPFRQRPGPLAMFRCIYCDHSNPADARTCGKCGADLVGAPGAGALPPGFEDELRSLLSQQKKIEAVKRYREVTGAGLAQSKDAVEAIERGQPPSPRGSVEHWFEQELVTLLREGKKIEAIRRYRKRTGEDLKASKEAVERLAEQNGVERSGGAGCFGMLVVVLALLSGWLGLR